MSRLLSFSIALLFASFYFIWVNAGVTQLEFLPAKPNQIAAGLFLIFSALGLLMQENRRLLVSLTHRCRLFICAYILFLFLQSAVAAFGSPKDGYLFILAKQISYFACALFLAAQLHGMQRLQTFKAAYCGLVLGLLVFVAVFSVISAMAGDGLFSLVFRAITQGDSAALQFGVYPTLFNFVDGTMLTRNDSDFQGTALRNTLVGVFVLFATALWFKPVALRKQGFLEFRFVNWTLIGCCIFFVLASVSRSNMLVLLLAASCLMFNDKYQTTEMSSAMRLVRGSLFVIAGVAGVALLSSALVAVGTGLANIGVDRFGSVDQDPRVLMYSEALDFIEQRPITGWGLGAELSGLGHRVHNLFLAAWYEGGLMLLAGSLVMYGSFVVTTLRASFAMHVSSAATAQINQLRNGGVLAIAILPLFRPLVSGDAGAFTLVEWTCIAIVLAEYANLKAAKSWNQKLSGDIGLIAN